MEKCQCKVCLADHNAVPDERTMEIMPARLAVLEKDHAAMERLRNDGVRLGCRQKEDGVYFEAYVDSKNFKGDPADAILAVNK